MKVKMRELIAEGKFWTEEHRANNKKHLKKVNEEILTSAKRSAVRKSPDSKRRQLHTLLSYPANRPIKLSKYWKGSSLASLKPEDAYNLPISKVRKFMTEYNSIKSCFAMDNNPNMGASQFYKRITLKALKYNKKRKSVTVRSSLEYNFVLWLEANQVPWLYEWSKLRYSVDGALKMYIPDFKIWVNGEIWVVETKGFYTKKSLDRERKKMVACAAKCRDRGYQMTILNEKRVGKRGAAVDPSGWTDVAALTDRQLFAFMRKQIPGPERTC